MDTQILNALQAKFGSADFSRYQIVRTPWYDTLRYPTAGASQLTFFTVPLGGTDPNSVLSKTYEQTNVIKPGSFGQTYFLLTGIRTEVRLLPKIRQPAVAVSGDAEAVTHGLSHQVGSYYDQLKKLFARGVLNIGFAQKQYFQIQQPFLNASPAYGVEVQAAPGKAIAGDAVKGSTYVGQDILFENMYQLEPIQLIEPEIQISATIDFPNGTSPGFGTAFLTTGGAQAALAVDIALVFDGFQIRPQQ